MVAILPREISMPYLYLATCIATKETPNNRKPHISVLTLQIEAGSADEAIGIAFRFAMREFPPSDGWSLQSIKANEQSKEAFEAMLKSARPNHQIPSELRVSTGT